MPSLPVETVTVRVAPVPVTDVIDAPDAPAPASAKSVESTPVTLSLKVTVHWTLAAFVGVVPARLIVETVGAVVSMTMFLFVLREPAAVRPGSVRVALLPAAS
jgi:hypothetical protein